MPDVSQVPVAAMHGAGVDNKTTIFVLGSLLLRGFFRWPGSLRHIELLDPARGARRRLWGPVEKFVEASFSHSLFHWIQRYGNQVRRSLFKANLARNASASQLRLAPQLWIELLHLPSKAAQIFPVTASDQLGSYSDTVQVKCHL